MSINAIEVLEAKLEHRRQQRIVEWLEAIDALPRIANCESLLPASRPEHVQKVVAAYHSPEWWDMMWAKHEAWREETYPVEAGTGFEVTPATGVEVGS